VSRAGNTPQHDRPAHQIRGSARTWRNLLLSLFVIVFLLGLGTELVLRAIYVPENLGTVIRFDRMTGWSLEPLASIRSVDYQHDLDYPIHINSVGLREREISIEKPKGVRRILVMGDTEVWGTGLESQWRYSDFLGRALDGGVEVINAGIPDWGTDQELIHFETLGRRLDPDLVILQVKLTDDVINNMLDHIFFGASPKPRFVIEADTLKLVGAPLEPPVRTNGFSVRKLLKKSRTLLFIKRRLDARRYKRTAAKPSFSRGFDTRLAKDYSFWSVYEKTYDEEFERAWEVTEAILLRFERRCEEIGSELIVFEFPERLAVDEPWRSEVMLHVGVDSTRLDFGRPHKRLAEFCARHGIEYYYPIEAFESEFREGTHLFGKNNFPNKYGNGLTARVLLGVLTSRHNFRAHVSNNDLVYMTSE
jgi:hypothetical protein